MVKQILIARIVLFGIKFIQDLAHTCKNFLYYSPSQNN